MNLLPICPECHCHSMIDIDDDNVRVCLYCDMLPKLSKPQVVVYENHCWNCGYGIDSRFSKKSPIPDMGYICNNCGKDLTEWKIKKGLVTISEIMNLK